MRYVYSKFSLLSSILPHVYHREEYSQFLKEMIIQPGIAKANLGLSREDVTMEDHVSQVFVLVFFSHNSVYLRWGLIQWSFMLCEVECTSVTILMAAIILYRSKQNTGRACRSMFQKSFKEAICRLVITWDSVCNTHIACMIQLQLIFINGKHSLWLARARRVDCESCFNSKSKHTFVWLG